MGENAKYLTLTEDNFDDVLSSNQVVAVDFWAPWCGPCRMIAPVIEEVADHFHGKAVVGKVDVDENESIAKRFGIMNIPTIIIFKKGEVAEKFVGYTQKVQLVEAISNLI